MTTTGEARDGATGEAQSTALAVLLSLSLCHLLNDTIQSLLPAIYPVLQVNYGLSYTQVGIIHMAFQFTASLLQPAVGLYTDRRPMFRLAVAGMGASLLGLLLLAVAAHYALLVIAAMAVGLGSAIFHPDASRVARTASGGRFGFAQSLFQVGGNTGTAVGPLLAAFVVLPFGQGAIASFAVLALAAMAILWFVGTWARTQHLASPAAGAKRLVPPPLAPPAVAAIGVLALLVFAKFAYMASMTSFYTFYVIETFGVSVRTSQLLLFVFLGAVALGTFVGGPLGDRFGRRVVIWCSLLGVLPFTLLLPHVGLYATVALSFVIGCVIASAFSAILVFAQSLAPGRVGLVSGLFFGFAFGVAGVGAAALGALADLTSLRFVFLACGWLPAIGLAAAFLPKDRPAPTTAPAAPKGPMARRS